MLLSLVDLLRCPAHDDDTSLVLSVEQWAGSRIAEGELGCPICHSRFRIHHGSIDFTLGHRKDAVSSDVAEPARVAAQLSLAEPGGVVLLTGRYLGVHEALAELTGVLCVLVNADWSSSPQAVNVDVFGRLPFADRVFRAAALDAPPAPSVPVEDVRRCVRPAGRILANARVQVPSDVNVLARDDAEWVGEVIASHKPLQLSRSKAKNP